LDKKFLHKNVSEDLTFAMRIKKVDTSFFGSAQGAKSSNNRAILRFKPLFCQPAPTTLAKKVYFGVLQHPSTFQAKILTGKF